MAKKAVPSATLVEVSGQEILDASEQLLAVMNQLRPEVAVAVCVLLAYSLVKGTQIDAHEAQVILDRFATLVHQGALDIQ